MATDEPRFPPSAKWSEVWQSYEWPRETEEQDIDYVYHGRMEALPKSTEKIVRIFLSSTFTDTVVERNMLMKQVFPEMRQYCRDKYDLDFQVVDMRWGVRQEASVDHSASELCMREIKNCGEVSLGPTFVTLLSHRYGSRPLRVRIPEAEMDILLSEMRKRWPEDVEHVLEWYQRDTNAVPPEYILKPLVKFEDMEKSIETQDEENRKNKKQKYVHLKIVDDDDLISNEIEPDDGDSNDEDDEQNRKEYMSLLKTGTHLFNEAQPRLKRIFDEVAKHCLSEGLLTEEQAERYCISVTEEEIIEGVRKNERRRDRCIAFIRELTDINTQHPLAWRFIDMEGDQVDEEAQQLMTKLRDETIPKLLPDENIFRFRAAWSDDGGVNERDHAGYLQHFCTTFKSALIQQIDRGVKASQQRSETLFSEILEHAHQCVGKVERFYGRGDVLDVIRAYLISASAKPLVIWGESGCGKTSVLAKAAKMTTEWLGDNTHLLIPVRFLGTTPDSSTIYTTLASLSRQLIRLCGLHAQFPDIPQEFADLKDLFKDILAAIPERQRVILFMDSLDQLSSANSAHLLQWLPLALPSNVKIVLSVLPKEHEILETLRHLMPDTNQYVEIENLETDTSHKILKMWLEMQHRRLSEAQQKHLDALITHDVRPLYLKLVFDEIQSWKSFENSSFDCKDIAACLSRLYRHLEIKHGKVLVSKALGFLSASKSGLTELEMEDILSLDEDVLTDVYQFHIPPIRRLPSILWARVRRDLDEYIVDRDADGTKVMAWYHRQFIEQANRRYLGVDGTYPNRSTMVEKNMSFYVILRDYFAGVWSGNKPKPFKYTEWQMKKLKKSNPDGQEIRNVSAMPNLFRSPDGSIDIENPRYNLRKLSELPPVCNKLGSETGMLGFIVKHIIMNPEFLCSWIKNRPWEEVSDFITTFARESEYRDESKKYTKIFKKQFEGKALTTEEIEVLKGVDRMLEGEAGLSLQISTIHSCLLLSYISVLQNPSCFGSNICGRLLIYHGIMSGIDDWVRYCDTKGRQLCALVPPHLQLETPGSELLFIINNHDGPVTQAMWAPQNESICYSFSTKLVAVSIELGQVIIDTRPRSVPKGDTFNKALFMDISDFTDYSRIEAEFGVQNGGLLLASLRDHPWLYVFTAEGDLARCIKCDEVLKEELQALNIRPEELRISDMKPVHVDDCVLVLWYRLWPHLIYLTHDFSLRVQAVPDASNVVTVARCKLQETGELVPIIYDDKGDVYIYRHDTKVVLQQFESAISAHHVVYPESEDDVDKDKDIVTCGLRNGKIVIIDHITKHMTGGEEFDMKDKDGSPRYGVPHFVKMQIDSDSRKPIKMLVTVCTRSHLLLLFPRMGKNKAYRTNTEYASDEEKTGNGKNDSAGELDSAIEKMQRTSQNKIKRRKINLVLRVKKEYQMAEITQSFNLLIAVNGGRVDLFQLKLPDGRAGNQRVSGRFFTSIDAHGQDVTRILTTEQDVLFMTASKDSTIKFWMVARAGVTRKYIPSFDRADTQLTNVIPGEDYTLAAGPFVRSINEWNIVKGRIARQFSHPSKRGLFRNFAPDEKHQTLYAIDMYRHLYTWSLEEQAPNRTRLKCRTTKAVEAGVADGIQVTQIPVAGVTDLTESMGPGGPLVIECAISNGLILSDGNGDFHHLINGDTIQVIKLEINNMGMTGKLLKLDANTVVVLGKGHQNTWHFHIYQAMSKQIAMVSKLQLKGDENAIKLSHTGEIIIVTAEQIVFYNPKTGEQRHTCVPKVGEDMNVVTSDAGVYLVYSRQTLAYCGLHVTSSFLKFSDWTRKLSRVDGDTMSHVILTHDGKYVLCVTNQRMLRLIRYSDGKLLALYTMYDHVWSLNVSTHNHYALIGTFDRRLFTLVIADPSEDEHDARIKYVRDKNPGLSREQAIALMGDANAFEDEDENSTDFDSSDDEALVRKAERRLDSMRKDDPNTLFCLQSDDESSTDSEGYSEEESRVPTRQALVRRESPMIPAYDNGLQPTAHDGQIFTPSPCALQ